MEFCLGLKLIIFGLTFKLLDIILKPYFWYKLCVTNRQNLPPIEDPLIYYSATTLAKKIREGELTSEKIIACYIKRIKAVNPIINAVVQERFSEAIEKAKNVDLLIRTGNACGSEFLKNNPLLGVPLTVKESCGLKGMKVTLGSLSWIDKIAENNGKAVEKLIEAGAIPVLISNTPEFCASWETDNYITGQTKNPYDTRRTPGGSSGGEGALLGSGASVIGIGSDVGGSIRVPSMYNGIFGHKPSRGLVPIEGHMPPAENAEVNKLLSIGPMCRYAEDLPIMLKVMSGDKDNNLGLDDQVELSKVRIFFMENNSNPLYQISTQPEVQEAISKSVRHLKDKCNSMIMNEKFEFLSKGFLTIIPGLISGDGDKDINIFKEFFRWILGKSQYTFQLLYFYALVKYVRLLFQNDIDELQFLAEEMKAKLSKKLGTNGILIYPNFPKSAPCHKEFITRITSLMYTQLFNVLGFPSTAVPMGFDRNNLPIGIQIIAIPNQDKLCLAVAQELSKLGGWMPPKNAQKQ